MTCPARHRHHGTPCSPSVCRAALLAMASHRRIVEDRERQTIPADSAEMVLTPDEWRAKYGNGVAA